MDRQFLAAPASSALAKRLFFAAGKMNDDLKKSTTEEILEDMLTISKNLSRCLIPFHIRIYIL